MPGPAPLFLSHGSPMLVLQPTPTTAFLRALGDSIGRPKAVVAVSAHWETPIPSVGAAALPATIHDFHGFPRELYEMTYPAPGAPEVAERAAALLGAAIDPVRGLDHGIWSVASLMWPRADVPMVPLSVQPDAGPVAHFELGRSLRPLADDGVLILATGSLTHNLGAYRGHRRDDAPEPWAAGFADWLAENAAAGRVDDLLDYRRQAPFAERNHPTDEHLLPFFVALGAAPTGRAEAIHRAYEYGVLAMDAYAFA